MVEGERLYLIPMSMPLRVLTLNIWNGQGPWLERLPLIRRGLTELQPDLVALQEVIGPDERQPRTGQLPLLCDGLHSADGTPWHVAYGPAHLLAYGMYLGNALLSRWPIVATEVWRLPSLAEVRGTAEEPNEHNDQARALLYALVEAPFGRVPIFITHLDWQLHRGVVRERQVAFLADRVAELHPPQADSPDYPPILAGDMNAEPDSDEMRFLRGLHSLGGHSVYFADCFRVAGPVHERHTGGVTYCRGNGYAAVSREPDRRIDYLYVRGPDAQGRGEPLTARVVFDQPESGAWASDHYGVYAELSV